MFECDQQPNLTMYSPKFLAAVRAKRKSADAERLQQRIDAQNEARSRRLEALIEEAAKARAEILAKKEARRQAAEAAGFIVIDPMAIVGTSAFRRIEARALKLFRIDRRQLRGPEKPDNIVFARHFICYWSRRLTKRSLPELGRLLGNRDHTTVLHGVRKYVVRREKMGRYLRPLTTTGKDT